MSDISKRLKNDWPLILLCVVLLVFFVAMQLLWGTRSVTVWLVHCITIFSFMIAFLFSLYLDTKLALCVDATAIAIIIYFNIAAPYFAALFSIATIIMIFFIIRVKDDNMRLLQLQHEKERDLHRALKELEKIGELKDEMIFIASHDLRTPVSIIRSNLSTIRDGYAGKINKEAATYVDAAYRAADRLRVLLEDLLEASILEHKEVFTLRPVQIEAIVKAIVEGHAKQVLSLKIRYPLKNTSRKVWAEEHMLQRALENLILNAIKFTKKGSITITVTQKGNMVQCDIADTGIGISQDAQDKLFTKFYRGANAVNSDTRGSGLGLYITKQIIQRLRGNISFSSRMNHGTTFTIQLPAVKT